MFKENNPFNVIEGTRVKRICGDRDRVGDIVFVKDIQPDGSCKFASGDYCTGNINQIGDCHDPFKYDYVIV